MTFFQKFESVSIALVENYNEKLPQFEISCAVDYQYNIGQSREIHNRRGGEGEGEGDGKKVSYLSQFPVVIQSS